MAGTSWAPLGKGQDPGVGKIYEAYKLTYCIDNRTSFNRREERSPEKEEKIYSDADKAINNFQKLYKAHIEQDVYPVSDDLRPPGYADGQDQFDEICRRNAKLIAEWTKQLTSNEGGFKKKQKRCTLKFARHAEAWAPGYVKLRPVYARGVVKLEEL